MSSKAHQGILSEPRHVMTLSWKNEEMEGIRKLMKKMQLNSPTKVIYQLIREAICQE